MHTYHFRFKLIGLCLLLILLTIAGVALAQEHSVSTEPGATIAAQDLDLTVTYDSATDNGQPPDDNPAANITRSPSASAATFRYYQVTGATLRGRNSDTGYVYDGSGCSHVTLGTGTNRILNTELPLPDGAIVKYLRVYYKDTNASNGVQGYITRLQPGGTTIDLVHTGSSAAFTGGYGFAVSSEITEVVDNTDYAYTLIGWPDDANINNQVCGLRVAYYVPTAFTFLPTIRK